MATTRLACSRRGLGAGGRGVGLGLGPGLGLAGLLLVTLLGACAPHHPADDLTLSTQVKIELLADRQLGSLRLEVSTLGGIVTLSGTVTAQADVDRAVATVKRVHGVRGVKSDLKIASSDS